MSQFRTPKFGGGELKDWYEPNLNAQVMDGGGFERLVVMIFIKFKDLLLPFKTHLFFTVAQTKIN